jgi:hypothetical protein
MPHARMKNLQRERGVHKSTGGIAHAIPGPVDPVDAAPPLDFEHSRSLAEREKVDGAVLATASMREP